MSELELKDFAEFLPGDFCQLNFSVKFNVSRQIIINKALVKKHCKAIIEAYLKSLFD